MFPKSNITFALEQRLEQGNQGDELLPEEVEAITHLDSFGSKSLGYHVFLRVARRLERATEGELCWRWDRNAKVYRCLRDVDKPADIGDRNHAIYRFAKRNLVIAGSVNLDLLTPEARSLVQVQQVTAGMLAIMASRNTSRKLLKAATLQCPSEQQLFDLMKSREGNQLQPEV